MAYKPKASAATRIAESKAFGHEPDYGSDFTTKIEYIRALNWYSRAYDSESGGEWLADGMKQRGYNHKQVSAAKRSGNITPTIAAISRMISRDCLLPPDSVRRWEQNIKEAVRIGQLSRESVQGSSKSVSPAERNRLKAMSYRAELDGLFDDIWTGVIKVSDIKFFDVFKELDMKPSQASIIVPFYEAQLNELKDKSIERSSTRIERLRLTDFMEKLVESLKAHSNTVTESATRVKKPAKKVKKPVANVNKLKFKKQDEDTKLVSFDPRQIVGAQLVVLYNAKYKQLAVIRAAGPQGLSVKGTTILNHDPKTSEAKRAGRHTDTIKQMASAPKTSIQKLFASISSTPTEVRTRTSEDTVLVRAIK